MYILIKIIFLIIAFCLGKSYCEYGEYICGVISYFMVAFLTYDLGQRCNKHMFGEYTTSYEEPQKQKDTNHYAYYNDWGDYEELEQTATNNPKPKVKTKTTYGKWFNNNSTQKDIDNLVAKVKPTQTNIEFCEEIKVEKSDKIIHHKKETAPTTPKLAQQKAENRQKEPRKELIMVVNREDINVKRKSLYEAILGLLKDKKIRGDKMYAMLQSFAHIDISLNSIVFYIDSLVLTKAKIAINEELMNEIREVSKKALSSPDLVVEFVEKKNITLLNYFLKDK